MQFLPNIFQFYQTQHFPKGSKIQPESDILIEVKISPLFPNVSLAQIQRCSPCPRESASCFSWHWTGRLLFNQHYFFLGAYYRTVLFRKCSHTPFLPTGLYVTALLLWLLSWYFFCSQFLHIHFSYPPTAVPAFYRFCVPGILALVL